MAKETSTIEVHLRNDWYTGSRLLRPSGNPHTLPPEALESLPSSAQVKQGDDLVLVEDLRKEKAPAKKEDLKL